MIFSVIGFIWGVSLVVTAYFFYKKGYTHASDDIVAIAEMIAKYSPSKEQHPTVDVSKRTDLN